MNPILPLDSQFYNETLFQKQYIVRSNKRLWVNMAIKSNEIIVVLVTLMIVSAILPSFVTTVQDVNTTAWSFTGYAGAVTLWNLLPFIFIAAITLGYVAQLIKTGD